MTIKNADFNPKLICWIQPFYEGGSYGITIQSMGCEQQRITYGSKENRDQDYEKLKASFI